MMKAKKKRWERRQGREENTKEKGRGKRGDNTEKREEKEREKKR